MIKGEPFFFPVFLSASALLGVVAAVVDLNFDAAFRLACSICSYSSSPFRALEITQT